MTAYFTQVYHKASGLYNTALELQNDKGAQQTVSLFGTLKKNQKDVIESLNGGSKDFLYEAFNKSLMDIEALNARALSYSPMANESIVELNFSRQIAAAIESPFHWLFTQSSDDLAKSGNAAIDALIAKGKYGPSNAGSSNAVLTSDLSKPVLINTNDLDQELEAHFNNIKKFEARINVGFDPLIPPDYSAYIFQFQQGLSALGLWILPALYGALGAVIFLMRRVLDPTLPSPTWLRFPFRIILGGFAGIILIWLWAPSATATAPSFASLGSFGIAFIVGYSTDVLFQGLDRLVVYMSQAVGK